MIAAEAIRGSVTWEADVTPMPIGVDSEPSGRHAAVMLAANGAILHMELDSHPPSDAMGVAKLLAKAIDIVLARGGAPPAGVIVRHAAVAAELAQILGARTMVVDTPKLPMLEEFAASLRQHMTGLPLPAISNPEMWAAWDLPAETLHRLFSAAASFYVAAPWSVFDDGAPLELVMPTGARWTAVILGNAGEQFGLVLYEKLEDYLALLDAPTPDIGFNATEALVISLSFDARADLPKPMRREFADAKWTVAGPSAYPTVWVMNTIGGGLSEAHADDLTMALEVLARIGVLRRESNELLEASADSWTDETSGTIVRFGLVGEPPYLWDVPAALTSSLAEGALARPLARYDAEADDPSADEDAAIVARFAAAMRASGADAKRVTRDQQNVEFFVELMHGMQGIPLAAVTEFDLRSFLYDLLPRKTMTTKSHANAIRASLKRFVDYLAASEKLRYPWASAILRDKLAFEDRWDSFPGGHWWDAEVGVWMGELYADLDTRVMMPSSKLAGLGAWGEQMGIAEASLNSLLQRQWLIWRDEEIALGHTTPSELVSRLAERQAVWEQAPQPQLGGLSPSEEIAKERGTGRRAKPRTRRS